MAAISNVDKSLDQIIKENKKQIRLQVTRATRNNKAQQTVRGTNLTKKFPKKTRPGVTMRGRATGGRNITGKKNLGKNQLASKRNQKPITKLGNKPQGNRLGVGNNVQGVRKQNYKKNNMQLNRNNQQQGTKSPTRRQMQFKQLRGKQQNKNNQNQMRQQQQQQQQQNRRKQNRQSQMNARRNIQSNVPAKPKNTFNTNRRKSTPGVQKHLMRTQQWKHNQGTSQPDIMNRNRQKRWGQNKGKTGDLRISVSNNVGFGSNLNARFSSYTGKNGRTITLS